MMLMCDECGANAVTEQLIEETFPYGSGDEQVMLSALVPVFQCSKCGDAYTGEAGEIARHAAVCDYLGRLRPVDIKSIRESYNLSQDNFADVSGFGVASVKRWESGNQIQSESADVLLRLLRVERNFRLVQAINNRKFLKPTFKTTMSDRTKQQAREFQLRPTHAQSKVA